MLFSRNGLQWVYNQGEFGIRLETVLRCSVEKHNHNTLWSPTPPQKRQKISFDVDTWRLTLLSMIESTFTQGGGKEESSQSCSRFWPFPPLQACLPCSFWTEADQVQFVDHVIIGWIRFVSFFFLIYIMKPGLKWTGWISTTNWL